MSPACEAFRSITVDIMEPSRCHEREKYILLLNESLMCTNEQNVPLTIMLAFEHADIPPGNQDSFILY